jgi:hypothetical protein
MRCWPQSGGTGVWKNDLAPGDRQSPRRLNVYLNSWRVPKFLGGGLLRDAQQLFAIVTLVCCHKLNIPLSLVAGTTGLEPATSAVTGQRSNQLSYVPPDLLSYMI